MSDLSKLLATQDRDSAIDRLRYRRDHLEEGVRLTRCESEIAALAESVAGGSAHRRSLVEAQSRLEAEAASLTSRIESLDKQMYGGTVTAARDLQAMAHEFDSLKAQRDAVEERVLAAMEEVDVAESELARLAASTEALVAEAESLRVAVSEAEAAIDVEIAAERAARRDVAAGLSADLVARYESLRAKLDGVAVARLVNGRCEGCHLSLPSVSLDRIRHAPAETVSTCDECGRILVLA